MGKSKLVLFGNIALACRKILTDGLTREINRSTKREGYHKLRFDFSRFNEGEIRTIKGEHFLYSSPK